MDTKPTIFVAAWFGAAFTSLIFCLFLLIYLSTVRVVQIQNQNLKLYAALPRNSAEAVNDIGKADARAKIIENFFRDYNSLLADYSETFVKVADENGLDYRVLPAISMQESNGGRKVISNSKNPFGYGIYGKQVIRFNSWEEAIIRVGKALREDYLNQGLKTPAQIMTKYTPPSLAKGGTWAKGVNSFMEELQ